MSRERRAARGRPAGTIIRLVRVCMLVRNRLTRDARVRREAASLSAAGHEVTVVALRGAGLPEHEETDGVRILRTVSPGRLAGPTIASEAGSLAAPPRGRRGGAGAHAGRRGAGAARAIARPSAAVWARDRILSARFTRAAGSVEADVYHAHDLNTLEAAWRAARARGARLVYDAHELYPDLTGLGRGERRRWRRLESRLIGEADAVIVPSGARGEALARRYAVPAPHVVMNCPPGGPPPDPAASPLSPLRRPGELLCVYAGGFTLNRGLEEVAAAVGRQPGVQLALVGWGPLEGRLRAFAASPAAGGRVTVLPPVEPEEVIGLAAGADAGLVCYLPVGLNNRLAAPNKIFEYLHAGLAIAASDLPEIRRVVEAYDVGVLFDPADPQAAGEALGQLASDPARLSRLRARAREAAPAFTWEAQASVLLAVYGALAR